MTPIFSIIIPVKKMNEFLREETIPAILEQSCQDFEIIILPDRKSSENFPKTKIIPTLPKTGPADKRDLGVTQSKGQFLAFLDDDSYPEKHWLERALKIFGENEEFAAIGGPAITPKDDNILQKASGYVWSSWLGSGGAGTYRCRVDKRRQIDDYPTVNFLIRKKSFLEAGGFDSHYWPGEDTKLCLDVIKKLHKKIIYDPGVLVYHHRRPVFISHLKQIGRYAIHRGHFARIFPETSFRIGYLMPTLFTAGLLGGFSLLLFMKLTNTLNLYPFYFYIYLLALLIYLAVLFITSFKVFRQEKNLKLSFLVVLSIFFTHIVYGSLFVKGFLTPKLER